MAIGLSSSLKATLDALWLAFPTWFRPKRMRCQRKAQKLLNMTSSDGEKGKGVAISLIIPGQSTVATAAQYIEDFAFVSATGLFLWLPYQVHVEQFFAKYRERYRLVNTESARDRCQRQVKGDLKRFAGLRLPTVFVDSRTQTETEAPELWARLTR